MRTNLALAVGLCLALAGAPALAQGPSYESRGYGGTLYVGPNFQQGGQHAPPVYGPKSSKERAPPKRRVSKRKAPINKQEVTTQKATTTEKEATTANSSSTEAAFSPADKDTFKTCTGDDADKAIAACTRLISNSKISLTDRSLAYMSRGIAYDKKGDHDQAITEYTKAIEHDGKNSKAYTNRGNSYYDKGDFVRATTDFTKAIEILRTRE